MFERRREHTKYERQQKRSWAKKQRDGTWGHDLLLAGPIVAVNIGGFIGRRRLCVYVNVVVAGAVVVGRSVTSFVVASVVKTSRKAERAKGESQ